MARRQEFKMKTPAEILQDLRDGHHEAIEQGPEVALRYLEKVLSSQHSLPNAVKFFLYDLLVEAAYQTGENQRCLEAIEAAQRHLPDAQEAAPRDLRDYLPQLRFCERGISLLADADEVERALALCDEAIALGLGKAFQAKRQSLERRS